MLKWAPSASLNVHGYSQMIINEAESRDEKDNSSLVWDKYLFDIEISKRTNWKILQRSLQKDYKQL